MADFITSFPFQLLVRGMVPGALFVVSSFVARYGRSHARQELETFDGTFLAVMAVVSGVLAYTCFRSAIYPLIEKAFDHCIRREPPVPPNRKTWHWWLILPLLAVWSIVKSLCAPWSISKVTCDSLVDHWTVNSSGLRKRAQREIIGKHNKTWNDYIHFQYTSALCIAAGAAVGHFLVPLERTTVFEWPLLLLALVLFFSAGVSDWRRRVFMVHFFKRSES